MVNQVREIFRNMADNELLNTVSFFRVDYTPETLDVLWEVAASRGISEAEVLHHRDRCYPELDLHLTCSRCESDLILEKDEFVSGSYCCPKCGGTSEVNYVDLGLPRGVGEDISKLGVVAAGSILGAIIVSFRENQGRIERRERILDGTYWKALEEIASLKRTK